MKLADDLRRKLAILMAIVGVAAILVGVITWAYWIGTLARGLWR